MPVSEANQRLLDHVSNKPIQIDVDDIDSILAALDIALGEHREKEVPEGRRIEFVPGKRKVKDGSTKRTGHYYWVWAYKDPDTGKRKRPYGGKIETVPEIYQYRRWEYEARVGAGSPESLANAVP